MTYESRAGASVITAPSADESLRVVLIDGRQCWNVEQVRISERWITFRSGGTRYDVPLTSVVAVMTHSALAADRDTPGLHDGRHGRECFVCYPVSPMKEDA